MNSEYEHIRGSKKKKEYHYYETADINKEKHTLTLHKQCRLIANQIHKC